MGVSPREYESGPSDQQAGGSGSSRLEPETQDQSRQVNDHRPSRATWFDQEQGATWNNSPEIRAQISQILREPSRNRSEIQRMLFGQSDTIPSTTTWGFRPETQTAPAEVSKEIQNWRDRQIDSFEEHREQTGEEVAESHKKRTKSKPVEEGDSTMLVYNRQLSALTGFESQLKKSGVTDTRDAVNRMADLHDKQRLNLINDALRMRLKLRRKSGQRIESMSEKEMAEKTDKKIQKYIDSNYGR